MAQNLALTAVYFGCGKFGLSLAFVHTSASAVWPATGVALAALLVWGYRLWPGIFLGAAEGMERRAAMDSRRKER